MHRRFWTCALLLAGAASRVWAVGHKADVTLIDRETGSVMPAYFHQGDYWVAGQPGARYAISVRNKLGERLLAVVSVDGVNVLSGETAGWDQGGYVFDARNAYQITGWRKSNSEVAAFAFATADDSYAARTGRPGDVGVVGVALFRERPAPVVVPQPQIHGRRDAPAARGAAPHGLDEWSKARSQAHDQAALDNGAARENESQALADSFAAPRLGTAHGAREWSAVSHTRFERLHATPDEVIRIRYDSRANLIAMGVIREPRRFAPIRPANPFPQSEQAAYVPDPPARRY